MGAKPKKRTITKVGYNKREPVKIATSNLFIETENVPVDYMVGAIFGEIGGQEFINYDSAEILTNPGGLPMSNLQTILDKYSPSNILSISDGSSSILSEFDINLNNYLLSEDLSVNQFFAIANPRIYIDSNNKNIVIELEDEAENFVVEVEFLSTTV